MLRQVEQQHFAILRAFDRQLAFVGYGCAIALIQLLAIQFDCAFCDLEPSVASVREFMADFFSCIQQGYEEFGVLIDLY